MRQILVRNIDDEVLERLRQQAKREGKSAEQFAREVIAEKAKPSREEIIRRMDEIRARSKPVDLEMARRLWAEHIRERDGRPFDPNFPDEADR